jgi:Fe-S cluster biosynthesis and repair protein YggX
MTRKVKCVALGQELDGLAFQPYPGELGKRIYENVSQQAWQKWMGLQTMLINENRLSPLNPEHRKYLEAEMVKYLFEGGSEAPAGYVPPDEDK